MRFPSVLVKRTLCQRSLMCGYSAASCKLQLLMQNLSGESHSWKKKEAKKRKKERKKVLPGLVNILTCTITVDNSWITFQVIILCFTSYMLCFLLLCLSLSSSMSWNNTTDHFFVFPIQWFIVLVILATLPKLSWNLMAFLVLCLLQ